MTELEASREEWLNKRMQGIGSSDAPAVVGVSKWGTALQVWENKRGLVGPQEDSPAMEWGRRLEPLVRQKYSDVTGRAVRLPVLIRSEKYPFMLASLDGITDDKRIVEIKTAGSPYDFGEEGTDEIPLPYVIQVQHQMIVSGYEVADVPVLIGGRDFRIYTVEADAELQEMLIQKEKEFWDLVITGVPPAPVNYRDVLRLYKWSEVKEITATEEVEVMIRELQFIRRCLKEFEIAEEETKKIIMEFMKEADTLVDLTGKPLATWRTGKGITRFDMETFKLNHKEIWEKYLRTGEAPRRFILKGETKNGNK